LEAVKRKKKKVFLRFFKNYIYSVRRF